MINILFNLDEWVAVGEDKFDTRIKCGEYVAQSPHLYQFVGLNPMKAKASRADDNVSAFRNFLIELDFSSLEDQYKYIVEELEVPFSTCTFSGSKSLHFIIALTESLANEEEWRVKAELLLKLISKADQKNKNPSRFTRIGGGWRPDTQSSQDVIETRARIELAQLDEWMRARPNYWKILKNLDRCERYVALNNIKNNSNDGVNSIMSKIGRAFLKGEVLPGSRNQALFVTTCDLVRAGEQEEAIRSKLVPIALQIGLSLRESNVTISSGIRKALK